MLSLVLLGSVAALTTCVLGAPDAAIASGGFQPLPHARGVPQGKVFSSSSNEQLSGAASVSSSRAQAYGGGGGGGGGFGGGPTKTIYVNVPPEQHPAPKPIAAGPPRKHYRIVFIRSPSPPPPQPIIPPRVEQKTLIYVLHPKQQQQTQNVVEVPDVKHDPQVYFIQYDDEPPTAEDLQDLVRNTIDGHGAAGGAGPINFAPSGHSPSPAAAGVFPPSVGPSYFDNLQAGNEINVSKKKRHNGGSSIIQQQPAFQSLKTPHLIRARTESKEVHGPATGFQKLQRQQQQQQQQHQHPQQAKFIRTRSSSSETKVKRTQQAAPSKRTRISEFLNRKRPQKPSGNLKRFARNPVEPSDELKAAFKDSISSPFRYARTKMQVENRQGKPASGNEEAPKTTPVNRQGKPAANDKKVTPSAPEKTEKSS